MASQLIQRAAKLAAFQPNGCKSVKTAISPRTQVLSRAKRSDCDAACAQLVSDRRQTLLGGAAILAAPVLLSQGVYAAEGEKTSIAVRNLNSFQKAAERAAFQTFCEDALRKELTANDTNITLRLVLHDAGTYDIATNTGGMNGSIFLREELDRPENKELKPIVDRLRRVKEEIDANVTKAGFEPISYADLEVLAAKVAATKSWAAIKIKQSALPSGGEVISSAFGATFNVRLGRRDATEPDLAGRLPSSDASVAEIVDYFNKLNNKNPEDTGFFSPKPQYGPRQVFVLYTAAELDPAAAEEKFAAADPRFKEYKSKYDRSRRTVTRTDYEVDWIDYFTMITSLGANFDPYAYLKPIAMDVPKL